MEIRIRDVDPVVANKYDELAKKSGVSRQGYLHTLLTNFAILEMFAEKEKELTQFIEKQASVIQENTKALEKVAQILEGA